MTVTTVYLIRHGETDWNVTQRWQGHTDIPLNQKGVKQAQLLAQRLCSENVSFNAIYSSDLLRALQTAWILGSSMKTPVELLPPLREIDLGCWSGLTRLEVQQQFPVEFALLEQGQDIPRGGGETLFALRERVVKVVEAMTMQHLGERLAFVTHGGPVRMMLKYVCEQFDVSQTPCHHIGNTSISVLHYFPSNGWQVIDCNDVSHLEGDEQAPDLMSAPPDDAERPVKWNP